MKSNNDLIDLIRVIDEALQDKLDKISVDELIAVMLEFCKVLGETKGLSKKELRRGIKTIVDLQLR